MSGGRGARRGLRCQNQLRWSDMTKRTCSIDGCEREHYGRGWCQMHYGRWRSNGDPLVTQHDRFPFPENLLARMEPQPNGCIWFTGARDPQGYGRVWNGEHMVLAHRAAYEHFVGPIPEGLTLDHECHNRSGCNEGPLCLHRRCANWEHLAPKPLGENTLASPNAGAWANKAKTHCPHGHEYTAENTYVSAQGHRACRLCRRDRNRIARSQV